MKTSYLIKTVVLFFGLQPVFGQAPEISGKIAPVGTKFNRYLGLELSLEHPVDSGAAQTWDFSAVKTSLYYKSEYIKLADVDKAVLDSCPTATHAYSTTLTFLPASLVSIIGYDMLKLENDKLLLLATKQPGETGIEVTKPISTLFTFPMSIGGTGKINSESNQYDAKYESYGTLKISETLSYNNVVRIKYTQPNQPTNYKYISFDPYYMPIVEYVIDRGTTNKVSTIQITFPDVTVTTSTEAIVDEALVDEALIVYPNPTSESIFLKSGSKSVEYSIYNAMGKLLKKDIYINSGIDVSQLISGNYHVVIKDNEKVLTANFVKQ